MSIEHDAALLIIDQSNEKGLTREAQMIKPLESDWRVYSKLVPLLRDRFLKCQNEAMIAILSRKDKNPTDIFWEAKSLLDEKTEILNHCLSRHSRSNMWISILSMHHHGMMQDHDLAQFSESLSRDVLSFGKLKNQESESSELQD